MRAAEMARLAWSYERVSSSGQLDGDGLARQSSLFLPFCERHGLQPAPARLADAGVSAYSGAHRRRGTLGKFLADAAAGSIPAGSVLVLEDLDRFSREASSHAERLLLDLFDAGLALGVVRDDRVVDRNVYDSDLSVRLQFLIRRDAAHDYSEKLGGRVSAAWSRRVDGAMAGRKLPQLRPFWCDWDAATGDFVLNHHAEMVRLACDLATEGLGATRVAIELNRRGFRTASWKLKHEPKEWTHVNAYHLTRMRQLIGEVTIKRKGQPDQVLPGYLPPLLTIAEFDAMQAQIRARRRHRGRVGRGKSVFNLLQGMIFCTCGRPLTMSRRTVRGRLYEYLYCNRNRSGADCDMRFVRYDEDLLLHGLVSERWDDFFKRPADNRKRRDVQRRLQEVERQQAEAAGKADRASQQLADLLGDGLDAATARRLSAAAGEAEARVHDLAQRAALLRAELVGLDGQDGRVVVAEMRQRVKDFLLVGRNDPGERSRLNSWLMLQGFRADLVDAARGRFRWGTLEVLGRHPRDGSVVVADRSGGVIWQTLDGRDYFEAVAEQLADGIG